MAGRAWCGSRSMRNWSRLARATATPASVATPTNCSTASAASRATSSSWRSSMRRNGKTPLAALWDRLAASTSSPTGEYLRAARAHRLGAVHAAGAPQAPARRCLSRARQCLAALGSLRLRADRARPCLHAPSGVLPPDTALLSAHPDATQREGGDADRGRFRAYQARPRRVFSH